MHTHNYNYVWVAFRWLPPPYSYQGIQLDAGSEVNSLTAARRSEKKKTLPFSHSQLLWEDGVHQQKRIADCSR